MLDRLLGLETEYAIRYSGPEPRPDHELIYEALAEVLRERVAVGRGTRKRVNKQLFLENGGAIYYEFVAEAATGGLIEASTPECRGPSQLLLYQKAQERLLVEALPALRERLAGQGHVGEIGLLKNCRDAEGNVYGAQENYEVEFARGPALWAYRVGLSLLLPFAMVSALIAVISVLVFALVMIVALIVAVPLILLLALVAPAGVEDRIDGLFDGGLIARVVRGFAAFAGAVTTPCAFVYALLFRLCCARRIRRDGLGFLLSRPVLTGAGSLDPRTGAFGLSEKGPVMRRLVRMTGRAIDRSIFDIGNLIKDLFSLGDLRPRAMFRLFRRRQRLQLGLSDSNVAQTAEYLKVATTALVLDMCEAGVLADLPRVRRPIASLHQLIADPSLEARVPCSDGQERTALELQRLYLERAEAFVRESDATSIEAREIVRLWSETLDALEASPASLFGRLDWVSKRALLEDGELDGDARAKIDLKYHELGVGYLARLEAEGLAPTLVDEEEVEAAVRRPPEDSPARRRSQLVRTLAAEGVEAVVGWDRVVVPKSGRGRRVIRLDDYRRPS